MTKLEMFQLLQAKIARLNEILISTPDALAGVSAKTMSDLENIKKVVAAQAAKMGNKTDKGNVCYSVLITDSPLSVEKDSVGNIIKYTATRIVEFVKIDYPAKPTLDYNNIYAHTEGYILKFGQVPTVLGSAKGGNELPPNAAIAVGIDLALTLDALLTTYRNLPDTVLMGTITWVVNPTTVTEICYHYKITDGDYKYNESAKTFSATRTVSRTDNPSCEPTVIEYENLYTTGSKLKTGETPTRLKSATGKAFELPTGTKTKAAYDLEKIKEKFQKDIEAQTKGFYIGKLTWEVEDTEITTVVEEEQKMPRPKLNEEQILDIPFKKDEDDFKELDRTALQAEQQKILKTLQDHQDLTVEVFVTTPFSEADKVTQNSGDDEYLGKTYGELLKGRKKMIENLMKQNGISDFKVNTEHLDIGKPRVYYKYKLK